MASGVFTGTTNNQFIESALAWSTTPNVTANTSDVYVTLRLKKSTQSTSATSGTGHFNLQLDGTGGNPHNIGAINIPNDGVWRDYRTWGFLNVGHAADGTRSMPMAILNLVPDASYSGLPGTSFTGTYVSGTAVFDTLHLAPAAPGAPSVARVSDTQQNLSWALNAAVRAPYSWQVVQRSDNVGGLAVFYDITGAISGSATAYSDTSTVADRTYQYRIRAVNSAGSATSLASASVDTTPGAPTNAVAAKAVTDVTLTWTDNSSNETGFDIEASQSGGTYAALATAAAGATSHTHTAPDPSKTWTYRVRSKTASLSSAWAVSNTVQLLTNPLAPSEVSVPALLDGAEAASLTWRHNPADGTAQTAHEVHHRLTGAAEWTPLATTIPKLNATATLTIASPCVVTATAYGLATGDAVRFTTTGALPTGVTPGVWYWAVRMNADTFSLAATHANAVATPAITIATSGTQSGVHTATSAMAASGIIQSREFPAGTLTNGKTHEIRVRTWGQYAVVPAHSPWSPAVSVHATARPVVTMQTPTAAQVLPTSSLTVTWTYHDPEGTAQTAFTVTLQDGAGVVLWTAQTAGAATSFTIPYALADGGSYKVFVTASDGPGLWSFIQERNFTVQYAKPMTPTLAVTFEAATGSAQVQITNPSPVAPAPVVTHNELWRSAGSGTPELVAGNVPPNGTVTDRIPAIGAVNTYFVRAWSATPSMAVSATAALDVPAGAYCHFNWGAGWSQHARLASNLGFGSDVTPDQRYYQFAGRHHPVMFSGAARAHTIACSADLHDDPAAETAFEALADHGGPVIYRDMRGRVVKVGAKVKMSEGAGPRITRVDVEMRRISA